MLETQYQNLAINSTGQKLDNSIEKQTNALKYDDDSSESSIIIPNNSSSQQTHLDERKISNPIYQSQNVFEQQFEQLQITDNLLSSFDDFNPAQNSFLSEDFLDDGANFNQKQTFKRHNLGEFDNRKGLKLDPRSSFNYSQMSTNTDDEDQQKLDEILFGALNISQIRDRNGKNNQSLLLQYVALLKPGSEPVWDSYRNGGTDHNPEFQCKLSFGRLTKKGQGKNQQQAEIEAASKILEVLQSQIDQTLEQLSNNSISVDSKISYLQDKDIYDQITNPQGALQEHCQQSQRAPPSYDLIQSNGPDHLQSFIVQVTLESHKAQGQAKTKKEAQHEAARQLMRKLNIQN